MSTARAGSRPPLQSPVLEPAAPPSGGPTAVFEADLATIVTIVLTSGHRRLPTATHRTPVQFWSWLPHGVRRADQCVHQV